MKKSISAKVKGQDLWFSDLVSEQNRFRKPFLFWQFQSNSRLNATLDTNTLASSAQASQPCLHEMHVRLGAAALELNAAVHGW